MAESQIEQSEVVITAPESAPKERVVHIEEGVRNQLNEELIRRSITAHIEALGEKPPDQENMNQVVTLIKQSLEDKPIPSLKESLDNPISTILTEDERRQAQERREAIEQLPYVLRSAANDILQDAHRDREKAAPFFQEMADFVSTLSQTGTAAIETKMDTFVANMDRKQWEVFRENLEVQRLLGRDHVEAADRLLGNIIVEGLLDQKEHTDESVDLGYKLLSFANPDTLPIIILNAYREPGHSGSYPFLDENVPSERTPLFKLVNGLREEQLQTVRERNVPGLNQVVELIRSNPQTFRDRENPVNQQIMQGLKEISLNFVRTGDEKMQFYLMGLWRLLDVDLGEGYTHLSRILLESNNPKIQDALLHCCLTRAEFIKDEKAIAALVQNFDRLNPGLQNKVQEMTPRLLGGLVGKEQVDPRNMENLSRLLGRTPQELTQTLSFIKGVKEGNPYHSYEASKLNEYIDLASNPDMLPFIQRLSSFGYLFSPNHATALKDLLGRQDIILGQLERIKQDFPDFEYYFSVDFSGGESRLLTDPYELVIPQKFHGVEGVIKGIEYLDKLPPEYAGKATETLVKNASRETSAAPSEQSERLLTVIFDFLHSRNLGETEIPIYDSLVETAGLLYTNPDLFYDSEELEGRIAIRRPKSFDGAAVAQIIAEGDPRKIFSCIYNFTDTYRYNLDEEYYASNIQSAHSEKDFALKMLESIADLRLKELATIRTFEYLLDPDLGNPELAEQLLARVTDPELKAHLESVYAQTRDRLARGETKYHEFFKEVEAVSPLNREELIKELYFSEERRQEQLEKELPRVQETIHVSINIRYENLLRVLRGDRRFKSFWETQTKAGGYDVMRDGAERAMGIRAKGTRSDPHPVYGAVWSENGRDERLGGAGGLYGESYVILRNDRIRERTTFTYNDSFDGYQSRMLTWEDAAYAKAMLNINNGHYVEAQVLGGVIVDDIESINIPLRIRTATWGGVPESAQKEAEIASIRAEVERLRQEFPNITFNFIEAT